MQETEAIAFAPFRPAPCDGRALLSGVSTGACIGHADPEALDGGIGKVREVDLIRIAIDRAALDGTAYLIGRAGDDMGADCGEAMLAARPVPADLRPRPDLPDDSRLWAARQNASGGTRGGCVFDVDAIIETLESGKRAAGRGRDRGRVLALKQNPDGDRRRRRDRRRDIEPHRKRERPPPAPRDARLGVRIRSRRRGRPPPFPVPPSRPERGRDAFAALHCDNRPVHHLRAFLSRLAFRRAKRASVSPDANRERISANPRA